MRIILFLFALLCTVAQGAWADEVTTQYANGVITGFTATSGTGDNYQNLVDGNNGSEIVSYPQVVHVFLG